MQEVRGGMMTGDGLPPWRIDRGLDPVAGLQLVRARLDAMPDRFALRLDIDDAGFSTFPIEPARIGGLPATFGIKRGRGEEDIGFFGIAGYRKDVHHGRLGLQLVVPDKSTGAARQRCRKAARSDSATITLALHMRCQGVQIHADTSLVGQLRGEFDREAESVMKIEHLVRDKSSALEQRLEALHSLP